MEEKSAWLRTADQEAEERVGRSCTYPLLTSDGTAGISKPAALKEEVGYD